jgi:hypothetical protein
MHRTALAGAGRRVGDTDDQHMVVGPRAKLDVLKCFRVAFYRDGMGSPGPFGATLQ